MSHIDDGTIHAYLDGALDSYPASEGARIRQHLESCQECNLRLDRERAIRAEAEAILDRSAPMVQMPPLEDLRAVAAHRTAAARARGLSRINRWSWAASVVLALGTGWMLRGQVPGTSPRALMLEPVVSDAAGLPGVGAPESEDPAGLVAAEDESRSRAQSVQSGSEAGAVGSASDGSASDGSAPPAVGAGVPAEVEGDAAPAAVQTDAGKVVLGGRGARAAESMEMVDAMVDATGGEEESPVQGQPASPSPAAAAAAAGAQSTKVSPPEDLTATVRRAAPESGAVAQPLDQPRRFEVAVAENRPGDQPARTQLVEAAIAGQDRPQSGSLVVPGLEVVDVVWLENARVEGIVRVRQLTEEGDTIEISHLPSGTQSSDLDRLESEGRTELVAPIGDHWVVLRGRVAADRLSAYLRLLVGG